jgi:nicotinamidase-related amidase
MKKLLIGLAIAAAAGIVACVLYSFIYFKLIDGVSTGTKITQGRPERSALLVIDIQEGITGKYAPKFMRNMARQSGPFIEKVNTVIAFASDKNMPVVYIRQEGTDKIFNFIARNLLARGNATTALDPRVKVTAGPVFTKAKMDAFTNPELDKFLQGNSVNHLYVTGLSATACVDRTIRAALNRGYSVTAIVDAIIGENVKARDAKCREWLKAGAVLLQADKLPVN